MSSKDNNYGLYLRCRKCEFVLKLFGTTKLEAEVEMMKESYMAGTNKLRCKSCKEWVDFELIIDRMNLATGIRTIGKQSRFGDSVPLKEERTIEKPEDLKPEDITI